MTTLPITQGRARDIHNRVYEKILARTVQYRYCTDSVGHFALIYLENTATQLVLYWNLLWFDWKILEIIRAQFAACPQPEGALALRVALADKPGSV